MEDEVRARLVDGRGRELAGRGASVKLNMPGSYFYHHEINPCS